ncbi:hypothetical protein [Intrasporangium chromatireducens]|nr:hypothetical protein [Intrasporangium chromatireducens]
MSRTADARRDSLAEHVAKRVAEWPPLTTAQRDRLALLLRGEPA